MDDDETVRRVGAAMLRRLGYEVVTAVDGAEAISLYKERHATDTPFVAVIMDLTVPGGVGGLEAIKGLKSFDAGVRAIVSSGYSTAPAMADAASYGFSGVVAKPFTIDDLVRELARVGVG
jgi:CheY-like chemotaxis protein